jgi:hypothetical protein
MPDRLDPIQQRRPSGREEYLETVGNVKRRDPIIGAQIVHTFGETWTTKSQMRSRTFLVLRGDELY